MSSEQLVDQADDQGECDRCRQVKPGPWQWYAGPPGYGSSLGAVLWANVCQDCMAEIEAATRKGRKPRGQKGVVKAEERSVP